MVKIKVYRIEANLTQHELSAATGIPKWKIQLFENGVKAPSKCEQDILDSIFRISNRDETCGNGGDNV